MHVELFRERDNVVATLQPLNCHLPECLGVPSYSSFCHSQFLSLHGVPIASVSASGFSPLPGQTARRCHFCQLPVTAVPNEAPESRSSSDAPARYLARRSS